MKKGLLLLGSFITLAGVANAQKLALYEEFSGENCAPCAALNPDLMTLLNANPTKVLLVKYQSPIPSAGPIYQQNTVDVQNRMQYYNVPFAPYGRLNGVVVGTGANAGNIALTTQAMIDAAAAETTPFSLAIGTPVVTGTTFTVPVTITANAAANYSNLKLRAALLEDLEFATPPGTNGETEFHHVMRKMYPNANGTQVQSSFTANQTQVINVTGTIPSYISGESAERLFAVWLQNDDNKVVLQSAKSSSLPGAINAIASEGVTVTNNNIICGSSATFSPTVTIKNTGSAPLTSAVIYYKIGTGAYQTQNWTGNLASGSTVTVQLGPLNTSTIGQNVIRDSVALPNGVADNDLTNNVSVTAVYLLNDNNEALPLSNDFETNQPNWVALPGSSGASIFRQNLPSINAQFHGYNQSNFALVAPFYSVQSGTMFHVLPKADMAAGPKALDFFLAYAQYQNYADQLEVVYSTDCGATWTSIWSKAGAQLATRPPVNTTYFPKVDTVDWRMESVDVSAVPQGARIAFRGTSDWGNYLWIDNVQLRTGSVVTSAKDIKVASNITTYPNPAENQLNIEMNVTEASDITFKVLNAAGQEMSVSSTLKMNIGNQRTTLDVSSLTPGVYLLSISTNEGKVIHKFVKK